MACRHCGLPVPPGLIVQSRPDQFCCHGCETAYAVIHSCGLDRFYALRDELSQRRGPVRSTPRGYAELDDPAFRDLYVRRQHELSRCELFLSGVHCGACVWLVERLPRLVPGVVEARVDLRREMVTLVWRHGVVGLSRIARVLDSIGYPPHPARDASARRRRAAEDRRQLVRLGVAGACAGNIMLLAIALYAGLFDHMAWAHATFFRWCSLLISLVSLCWPGAVFFRSAWAALRTRTMHLDIPIALALAAGGIWSLVSTIRGTGEIYFDTISALVFLLLVGRFVQQRQQRYAADAIELLFSLTPGSARRLEPDGSARDVPLEALHPGDVIEARAGDSFAADGRIIQGASATDESLLTGESRPRAIGPGDEVAAGAVNIGATVRLRVSATGEATRIGRLMRLVEEAAHRRAPIVRFADRAAGYFTVGMIGLSILTLLLWLWLDAAHAPEHAIALLVVTCPCALGLATPLTLTVALGKAARAGALIKGGDAIQRLAKRGTIYFDKTGTLTTGAWSLVGWAGDASLKGAVAALERHAAHPIALALTRDCAQASEEPIEASDVAATTGAGIRGTVGGRPVLIGSLAFLRASGVSLREDLLLAHDEFLTARLTPVAIAVDGRLAAVAALGDHIRPEARGVIDQLRAAGWRVGLLSGDHPAVVAALADRLDIEPELARGGLSPEDKLAIVRREAASGEVVMVGDGVNDAAALAAAGVGIAVHGGAEASLAAADIYLSRPGVTPILDVIRGSRRTMGVIRRGLAVSAGYNTLAGAIAVAGLISPIIAALVMPMSSLTALALSFRARTFGERT